MVHICYSPSIQDVNDASIASQSINKLVIKHRNDEIVVDSLTGFIERVDTKASDDQVLSQIYQFSPTKVGDIALVPSITARLTCRSGRVRSMIIYKVVQCDLNVDFPASTFKSDFHDVTVGKKAVVVDARDDNKTGIYSLIKPVDDVVAYVNQAPLSNQNQDDGGRTSGRLSTLLITNVFVLIIGVSAIVLGRRRIRRSNAG
jgi:hypothetical protein